MAIEIAFSDSKSSLYNTAPLPLRQTVHNLFQRLVSWGAAHPTLPPWQLVLEVAHCNQSQTFLEVHVTANTANPVLSCVFGDVLGHGTDAEHLENRLQTFGQDLTKQIRMAAIVHKALCQWPCEQWGGPPGHILQLEVSNSQMQVLSQSPVDGTQVLLHDWERPAASTPWRYSTRNRAPAVCVARLPEQEPWLALAQSLSDCFWHQDLIAVQC